MKSIKRKTDYKNLKKRKTKGMGKEIGNRK